MNAVGFCNGNGSFLPQAMTPRQASAGQNKKKSYQTEDTASCCLLFFFFFLRAHKDLCFLSGIAIDSTKNTVNERPIYSISL